MGKLVIIDGDKVRKELKSAERSLEYWTDLEGRHPEGNTHFKEGIARASGKIDAFKFVLNQCSR
jgi:hypothetical protein